MHRESLPALGVAYDEVVYYSSYDEYTAGAAASVNFATGTAYDVPKNEGAYVKCVK
jgi:hypothetical protein